MTARSRLRFARRVAGACILTAVLLLAPLSVSGGFWWDAAAIVWDGLRAHRSRLVRDYVDSTEGDIKLAFLPAYAPELNPVEYTVGLADAPRDGQLPPQRHRRT